MSEYRKTVAVDLDGVLAEYTGFKGPDIIEDPAPEARRLLRTLGKKYQVIVYTARSTEAAEAWLTEHGLREHVDAINYCQINGRAGKPVAIAYIDDRAVLWTGDLQGALEAVEKLEHLTGPLDTGSKPERRKLLATDIAHATARIDPEIIVENTGSRLIMTMEINQENHRTAKRIWDSGIPV